MSTHLRRLALCRQAGSRKSGSTAPPACPGGGFTTRWQDRRCERRDPPPRSLELGILATDAAERSVDLEVQDRAGRKSEAKSVKVAVSTPMVQSVDPVNGARGVPHQPNIRVTFSEEMDQASVLAFGAFTLADQSTNAPVVDVARNYNAANKTATPTPNAALDPGTTYAVTIKGGAGGVKNLAGNPLTADYAWAFTTA